MWRLLNAKPFLSVKRSALTIYSLPSIESIKISKYSCKQTIMNLFNSVKHKSSVMKVCWISRREQVFLNIHIYISLAQWILDLPKTKALYKVSEKTYLPRRLQFSAMYDFPRFNFGTLWNIATSSMMYIWAIIDTFSDQDCNVWIMSNNCEVSELFCAKVIILTSFGGI